MMSWDAVYSLLPLVVGLPLLAAIACALLDSHRWRVGLSILFAFLQLSIVVMLLLAIQHSGAGASYRYALGGWGAPLGIDLVVDGLAIILLLITALLVLILSIYSAQYFSAPNKAAGFWPLWWLLVAGLNAAFISADAFNIYVALEIIGLSAVALVALTGTRAALTAALRYALVGLLGSLCYLLGVALLYRAYGTLDLVQLASTVQANPLTWASLALISVGLLLKTALLPLHFWLPSAHASAPAPVSAVLSALVVKASFYLLVRFWLEVLAPATTEFAMNFLGLLGATAIVWGCIAAFRASRLKLLVAYSTVAQLGYLFLLFPLAAASDISVPLIDSVSDVAGSAALAAVIYFIIAHALAKAAMFLAAGNIQSCYGHDTIDKLQGAARSQPIAVFTFAIAGISLIGLPPSGGFIAKWLLLNSAIQNGQWWWVIVMLVGGLLAAVYIGRVLTIAFAQTVAQSGDKMSTHLLPRGLAMCGLVLAISAVLLGFNAEPVLALLEGSAQISSMGAGGL